MEKQKYVYQKYNQVLTGQNQMNCELKNMCALKASLQLNNQVRY